MVCGQKTEWKHNSLKGTHISPAEKEKNKKKRSSSKFFVQKLFLFSPSTQCYISDLKLERDGIAVIMNLA